MKLEKSSLEEQLKEFEGTVDSLKRTSAKKGESLERFQQKLGHIRVAMTKEVEKVYAREREREREGGGEAACLPACVWFDSIHLAVDWTNWPSLSFPLYQQLPVLFA